MIEVRHLTKYYGDNRGVEDVSFTIGDGGLTGLLGPNGAGKSTLMKMLTGYHMPTSGEIVIDGVDAVENPREAFAKVGFMPEIPPLYVDMTVLEFLTFIAHIRGVEKGDIAGRVAEVMETCSVAGLSGISPRAIVSGWAWPSRWWGARRSSLWTSPPWAWTPSRWRISGS